MTIGKESLIRTLKATIGITMLIVGGLLYIIYRTEHLLMFSWFHKIGLSPIIENLRENYGEQSLYSWVKSSLPAALWLFSYLFVIDSLWGKDKSRVYLMFLFALPIIAISSEFMQLVGLLPGTFDYMDLVNYVATILIFILIKKLKA